MKHFFYVFFVSVLTLTSNSILASTWMIGDNDGYGLGTPDNVNHPFDGFFANYDGRSSAEKLATDGAQYTDTYSTTQPSFGPQSGTVATFTFTGLGSGWTKGRLWFDMADFQATQFGAVRTTYNGISQDWAFNDGFPSTKVRFFDLSQAIINSINNSGALKVEIDRNQSVDFYGFDYALLSNTHVSSVPIPAALWLFGTGIIGLFKLRKTK